MSSDHHEHKDNSSQNLAWAFILNLSFSIFELGGGIYANSIAIISDSFHDFGDAISLAFVWYLQKVSLKPKDRYFAYGYKRFSLLGAVVISLLLSFGSIFIIVESTKRLFHPVISKADIMLYLAFVGVLINGIAMIRLSHGKSLSEKAVYLHFLEDILGWVAVLIGSTLMIFWEIPWLDPILSIGIALWILTNAIKNTKEVFQVFLQGIPKNLDQTKLLEKFKSISGVLSIHDVKFWSLDGNHHIASLHVVVKSGLKMKESEHIKNTIRTYAKEFDITDITIELESLDEKCSIQ